VTGNRANRSSNGERWATRFGVLLSLTLLACGEREPPGETTNDPQSSNAQAAPSAPLALARPPASTTVTLITGDRVTMKQLDGRSSPQIQHGPGRDKISFTLQRHAGEITVLPDDMAPLVAAGRVDRALFNVTRLLADGYGDDRRDDVPLIITGLADPPALRAAMASPGVTVDRTLPTLHMMALRQRKSGAGAALANLAAAAPGALLPSAGGNAKIWLDGRRRLLLDHSVPQIGAPAAYARGLTGAGVVVAVLDTGIDASHPDLAGKVTAAETFVDDGQGTSDVVGHATHVASIIAGTGAASDGQLHGVAPGATLVSGRVCQSFGCPESAILAGMEWAVATQHARIVNMSLGGFDDAEIDPLEEAVNQLSAQFGALFVVAAGNDGFGPGTIDSPSSAEAALSVGAVDRDDQRAEFSGQGPRIGDHAIKPDLTAPGVDIVAARAAGTELGEPVGASYVRLSGTSMATPHVAGAAALLLEQHPDWTGAQLKQALIGTAQPSEALSIYEQGAGRVDVDRATRQAITAEPASVSAGAATFPHDDDPPITRTVRYHNAGAEPIALSLAASLSIRGVAAPSGLVSLAPAAVTVPAGSTAEVIVTFDTRVDGPTGIYGGTLIASGAGGLRVVTPIGVEREVESHELTVRAIDRGGQLTDATIYMFGVGEPGDPVREVNFSSEISGQATFHLPRGTYTVITTGFAHESVMLVAPRTALEADATVAMDSRLARPTALTLPDADQVAFFGMTDFEDDAHENGLATAGPRLVATAEIGPSAAPGEVHTVVRAAYASEGEHPSVVYDLVRVERDHFITGWRQRFRRADFGTVHARHAGAKDAILTKAAAPVLDVGSFVNLAGATYEGPFERTEHYYGPEARWIVALDEGVPIPGQPGATTFIATEDTINDYPAGRQVSESWNQAPFGPAFAAPSFFGIATLRSGDILQLAPSMFSAQVSPARASLAVLDHARLTLRRGADVLAETTETLQPFLQLAVAPELAEYRLEADQTRPSTLFDLSTHVTAAWTFRSQHLTGPAKELPLPTLRFSPQLDEDNQTHAHVLLLPIHIERPITADKPSIAQARVDASFDDGAHWARVPIVRFGDRALGVIVHPRGATHVSLRGTAADVDGNSVEQTIIRAYALAAR